MTIQTIYSARHATNNSRYRLQYEITDLPTGHRQWHVFWWLEAGPDSVVDVPAGTSFPAQFHVASASGGYPVDPFPLPVLAQEQGAFTIPAGGERLLAEWTFVVAPRSVPASYFFTLRRTGGGALPPALAWAVSAQPARVMVERVNDSRHIVTSPSFHSSDGLFPYRNSLGLWRRRESVGTWEYVGRIGAGTWADTANLANDVVRWGIGIGGPTTGGPSIFSMDLWTTPLSASTLVATRSGQDVDLSWTIRALHPIRQTIQSRNAAVGSTDWGPWTNVPGHVNFGPAITSRRVENLDSEVAWQLRVITQVTWPAVLTSASGPSNTMELITPPIAPTLISPVGTVSQAVPVRHRWRHNPLDTTAQRQYQMRHRVVGGTWATYTGTVDQFRDLTLPSGNFEWQVRTLGAHADWSPWSAIGAYATLAPPVATITSPQDGGTIPVNRLTLEWDYTDPQEAPQIEWEAELVVAGAIVETLQGTVEDTATFAHHLPNLELATARVRVRTGNGLWSDWDDVTFSPDYALPQPATLSAVWIEEAGAVQLTIDNDPAPAQHAGDGWWVVPGGAEHVGDGLWDPSLVAATHEGEGIWAVTLNSDAYVPALSSRIERRDEGTWRTVTAGLPMGATWMDDTVPLNAAATYRVVTVADSGTESPSAPVTVTTSTSRLWLNPPNLPGISILLDMTWDSEHVGDDQVTVRYWGDELPTSYYGEGRSQNLMAMGAWVAPVDIADQNPQALLKQDVLWRDPSGETIWVNVTRFHVANPWAWERRVSVQAQQVKHG